jgi:hypothetical protein
MITQGLKKLIQTLAMGSVVIGMPVAMSGDLGHLIKRDQTPAVCEAHWGYNQTCWKRFPALPPCESGESCPTCIPGRSFSDEPNAWGSMNYQPQTGFGRPAAAPQPQRGDGSRVYSGNPTQLRSAAPVERQFAAPGPTVGPPIFVMPTPSPNPSPPAARQNSAVSPQPLSPQMPPGNLPPLPAPMPSQSRYQFRQAPARVVPPMSRFGQQTQTAVDGRTVSGRPNSINTVSMTDAQPRQITVPATAPVSSRYGRPSVPQRQLAVPIFPVGAPRTK